MSKLKAIFLAFIGTILAIFGISQSYALTVTNGKTEFGSWDHQVVEQAIENSVTNLWSGFMFILPYMGIAVGILLVFAIGRKMLSRGGR